MSTLVTVRHGQASFFEDHYDQLSEVGREQSRRLGEYWVRQGVQFDQVFTGTLQRQIDTAHIVGTVFEQHGRPWPEPVVMAGFDEYAAEAVLQHGLPQLVERHEHIRKLEADLAAAAEPDEQKRAFQRMYEVVIGMWVGGELPLADVEPWDDFTRRVHDGLSSILDSGGSGRRVAVFTSGGPIGVSVGRALATTDQNALETAWMVRNGSYSEFLFSRDRFTLSSFNTHPHLDDPALLTYR